MTVVQVSDYLRKHDVRPSAQRIAIMRYLMEHPVHPTAEHIHEALLHEIPTLSLTTVYTTLRLLSECGAVSTLSIDSRNSRFDYVETPHAHLWCTHCGGIEDVPFGMHLPDTDTDSMPFRIDAVEVNYRGVCSRCNQTD